MPPSVPFAGFWGSYDSALRLCRRGSGDSSRWLDYFYSSFASVFQFFQCLYMVNLQKEIAVDRTFWSWSANNQ